MAAVLPYPLHSNLKSVGLQPDIVHPGQYASNGSPKTIPAVTHHDHAPRTTIRNLHEDNVNAMSTRHEDGRAAETSGSGKLEKDLPNGYHNTARSHRDFNDDDIVSEDGGKMERPIGETHADQGEGEEAVLKLSPGRLYELTSSPNWLPMRKSNEDLDIYALDTAPNDRKSRRGADSPENMSRNGERAKDRSQSASIIATPTTNGEENPFTSATLWKRNLDQGARSQANARTTSSPLLRRRMSSKSIGSSKPHLLSSARQPKITPLPLRFEGRKSPSRLSHVEDPEPSPMPQSIPVPPLSLPTYLQLELSSQRPSPLYIHRSVTSDYPYESSRVKIDRLKNFFFLPPQLEQILCFGALACLDAWLYSFTILPLRFLKALSILGRFWGRCITNEVQFVASYLYSGIGRIWRRRRRLESLKDSNKTAVPNTEPKIMAQNPGLEESPPFGSSRKTRKNSLYKHQRTKSIPSALSADHKADILKGFLILVSCIILMYFDASRMYHGIRGQAAIKLYVIYNVLEVCDRLFSAIGQDVLECLFSKEALERRSDGRSKVWRPFWLFILALFYNLVHSTALFYQVITLNVAVNSYSNALLTLLMSNQFVEIKSTVFKKFEKENLFQLTCADVVERFQLWLMLIIIASRNIIETGGLSLGSSSGNPGGASSTGSSLLPKSFTMLPDWTGQVMGPFFLVLGSEMLVDWIKHAYITKFNNTKPAIYGRFLDILAKDYYSNAFAEQNLTRRLGLPVIPLACLFIRASVQTYHMFLATYMPAPLPSPATSISLESATASPATTAALQHIDKIFRHALGRSAFGAGDPTLASSSNSIWSIDNIIASITMAVFFLIFFLVLLALKLVLGMILLSFARSRYKDMKVRERTSVHAEGRRVGGWGVVEVDEDKRRWIYADDAAGARKLRQRERDTVEREKRVEREGGESFAGVSRYSMVAKRIW